jgi:hypothetical protein
MSSGHDQGYRVDVRIERPGGRGPQLVAAIGAIVLLGAITSAVLRLVHEPETAIGPTPSLPASGPPVVAIPTALPAIVVQRRPTDPIAPFPVISAGLRWLDPAQGRLGASSSPDTGGGWVFAGSDGGAWCVCADVVPAGSGTGQRTTIIRYGPAGADISSWVLGVTISRVHAEDAINRDVARSPDGSEFYVATTVRVATGWDVKLDIVRLTGTRAIQRLLDLGQMDGSPSGTDIFPPVVRVSRDGRLVRVAVRFLDRGRVGFGSPAQEDVWIVGADRADGGVAGAGGPGSTGPTAILRRPIVDPGCPTEAWASSTTYVRLCAEAVGDSLRAIAHLDRLDGTQTDIQVGDAVGRDGLDWLVDGRTGMVYRWSRFSNLIASLDVASRDIRQRLSVGPNLAGVLPDADRPPPNAGPALWQPLASAADPPAATIVGSTDGSLLFAIGAETASSAAGPPTPLLKSTGIWVFDAATFGLVAHWPAAAMYDGVGVSADGRYVLAVGAGGMTAGGLPAEWERSVAIHDAGDGALVEQIGQLAGDDGSFVHLLVPGPVP